MKVRWPPHPLGLGTPLNLALPSAEARALLARSWWQPLVLGLSIPLLMLLVDGLLFGGASLTRVRDLGEEPLVERLLIMVYSAISEELIYRVLIGTIVAWLSYRAIFRFSSRAKSVSQWLGVAVAAYFFGLAHVGNLPDIPHPVLRAVTVNGIAAIALGWLYWWRGLEAAILTHMVAIAVLYIGVPLVL